MHTSSSRLPCLGRTPARAARRRTPRLGLLLLLGLAACGGGGGGGPLEDPGVLGPLTQAKVLIEHNFTDQDTRFQGFVDGEPWNELTIRGPDGTSSVRVVAEGGLFDFGMTELIFETNEPPNAEEPIVDVLDLLDPGTHRARGVMVEGPVGARTTPFTHVIPRGPNLTSPANGQTGLLVGDVVVRWDPVTLNLSGGPVTIVGYQVIVEEDAEPLHLNGFYRPSFVSTFGASVRQVVVPSELLRPATSCKFEVLAIEASVNQTLALGCV